MVTMNSDPDAGGNLDQAEDGRDKDGRLPEPLDAAHFPPTDDGPAVVLPGMALGQPAGTSQAEARATAAEEAKVADEQAAERVKDEKAEAKAGGLSTENTPTRAAKTGPAKTG